MPLVRYRTVEVVVGVRVTDAITGGDLTALSVVERVDDRQGTVLGLREAVERAEAAAAQQVHKLVAQYARGRAERGEA